jgi:hypothetical protein
MQLFIVNAAITQKWGGRKKSKVILCAMSNKKSYSDTKTKSIDWNFVMPMTYIDLSRGIKHESRKIYK